MKKEYWEYLKKSDPIHYSEMMGDPVTGQTSEGDFIFAFVCFCVFLCVMFSLICLLL